MGTIRDNFRQFVGGDARVGRDEAQNLVDTAKNDGKVDATEKAELQTLVARHSDAFDAGGWKVLKDNAGGLGIRVGDPASTSLASKPELADVAAGKKALSSTKNRNDPAVASVQRALMALGRLTNQPALSLPRSGADSDFGDETTAAIKAFQSGAGLKADGVVGKNTLAALDAALKKATPTPAPPPAPPPPPGPKPVQLANARFDQPTLHKVANGGLQLGRGTRGEPVKAVQQALIDLGYPMPKFGADGDYGKETEQALIRFQKHKNLPASGTVDAATLQALDKASPAPATKAVHAPEYGELYKDGVLEVTMGIGFDETGADLPERKKALEGLAARGFKKLNVVGMTDTELKKLGVQPARVDRAGTYYVKKFQHEGKDVVALVKYVDRYTADPAARFGQGMAQSELVLYGGHARYGSGPDFDHKESAKGNFALGVNAKGHRNGALTASYDAHMQEILKDAPNALEATKLTDRYQMMFFSGCTTKAYLDELRGIPANKDDRNLDLIVSDDVLYWNNTAANVLGVLDGVMGGKDTQELSATLWNQNKVGFTLDGFVGNTPR